MIRKKCRLQLSPEGVETRCLYPADSPVTVNSRSLGQRPRTCDGRKCRADNVERRADGAWQSGDGVEWRGQWPVYSTPPSTAELAMNTSVSVVNVLCRQLWNANQLRTANVGRTVIQNTTFTARSIRWIIVQRWVCAAKKKFSPFDCNGNFMVLHTEKYLVI